MSRNPREVWRVRWTSDGGHPQSQVYLQGASARRKAEQLARWGKDVELTCAEVGPWERVAV